MNRQPIQPPKPRRVPHPPISFGGETDEFGNRTQDVSAVILPWSPQAKQFSRTKPKRYAGDEQHLDEEEAFQNHLDKYPDDHNHRMVFADWLEDRGDPRAEGYRALGQLGRHPFLANSQTTGSFIQHPTWLWGHNGRLTGELGTSVPHYLTPDWLSNIENTSNNPEIQDDAHWRLHNTRKEAEDNAALAFSHLPPERKQELSTSKQLSRKKVVIRYARPTLTTTTQKERAKKVELVVLPKSIEGKKCGSCTYGKRYGKNGLYCTNNQVHINVKSNWACKLWEGKGVKKLSRKSIKFSKPMINGPKGAGPEEEPQETELPDWEPQPKEQLNGKLVEGVLRSIRNRKTNTPSTGKAMYGVPSIDALGALGDHLQEIGHNEIGELISRHANGEGTSLNPKSLSDKVDNEIESPNGTHKVFNRSGQDHNGRPITWVSISHWKKVPLPNGNTRLDKVKSYAFHLPKTN